MSHIDFNSELISLNFSTLQQWKLMSTFRALSHSALNRGWTAGTSNGSTICYVKGKAAFWTANNSVRLRIHFKSLSLNQTSQKVLKTFSKPLRTIHAEILTTTKIINSVDLSNSGLVQDMMLVWEDNAKDK